MSKWVFKRIVDVLAVLGITLSIVVPVPAEGVRFKDVGTSDWYYESVEYVFENGLMKGVSDKSFDPEGNLTRGMCVTILFRVAGEPEMSGEVKFTDVKRGEYYALPVLWASNSGIVYGRTETSFVPDGTITRGEFSAMLFRYINASGLILREIRSGSPSDVEKIPSYAKDAVCSMYRSGIINGREGGVFDPDAFITRAETAAMIERFVSTAEEKPHVHSYSETVVEPTCTTRGYTLHECACGDSYIDGYVELLGHSFGEWIVTKEATVTESGEKARACSRPGCGIVETEPIPATGPSSPDEPTLAVSGAEAAPGETFELIVSVKNNPGFNAFDIGIVYDETFLSLNNVTISEGISGQFIFGKYAVWINDSDYTSDGPILVLSFTVKNNAPIGQTEVTLAFEEGDISNYDEEDVSLKVVPGIIDVVEP